MRKTSQVAQELGVTIGALMALMRNGRISRPGKDASGDFIWTDAQVERARMVRVEIEGRRSQREQLVP